MRVSTNDQDTEKNKAAILEFANEKDFGRVEFIEDKAFSGMVDWRQRKIGTLIEELTEGDRLIVPEITRLSRSIFEIFSILETALHKKIYIYSLNEKWELNGSIQSAAMAMAFGLAAQIERELISARTKEALAARKAAGVRLGRPPGAGKSKLDEKREFITESLRFGTTKTEIAALCGCTPGNLCNWLRKNNIDPWKEDNE